MQIVSMVVGQREQTSKNVTCMNLLFLKLVLVLMWHATSAIEIQKIIIVWYEMQKE